MTVEDMHRLFDYVRQQLAADGVDLYIIGDMGNGPSPPDRSIDRSNPLWLSNVTNNQITDNNVSKVEK